MKLNPFNQLLVASTLAVILQACGDAPSTPSSLSPVSPGIADSPGGSTEDSVASAQATDSSSGAFAMEPGTTIDALKSTFGATALAGDPGRYTLDRVSKPHAAFETYVATATMEHGLCNITGYGRPINTSIYGVELRAEFKMLEDALSAKYGQPQRFDSLGDGSIWNEPKDWMMSLLKKERTLAAVWTAKMAPRLPDHFETIMLAAMAIDAERGFVNISYEFDNFEACSSALRQEKDASL